MHELAELRRRLDAFDGDPHEVLDVAVGIYKEAAGYIDLLQQFQADVKTLIAEVFAELEITEAQTSTGKVLVGRPSIRVTYDARALDRELAKDPALAARLAPFRTEKQVAGTLIVR